MPKRSDPWSYKKKRKRSKKKDDNASDSCISASGEAKTIKEITNTVASAVNPLLDPNEQNIPSCSSATTTIKTEPINIINPPQERLMLSTALMPSFGLLESQKLSSASVIVKQEQIDDCASEQASTTNDKTEINDANEISDNSMNVDQTCCTENAKPMEVSNCASEKISICNVKKEKDISSELDLSVIKIETMISIETKDASETPDSDIEENEIEFIGMVYKNSSNPSTLDIINDKTKKDPEIEIIKHVKPTNENLPVPVINLEEEEMVIRETVTEKQSAVCLSVPILSNSTDKLDNSDTPLANNQNLSPTNLSSVNKNLSTISSLNQNISENELIPEQKAFLKILSSDKCNETSNISLEPCINDCVDHILNNKSLFYTEMIPKLDDQMMEIDKFNLATELSIYKDFYLNLDSNEIYDSVRLLEKLRNDLEDFECNKLSMNDILKKFSVPKIENVMKIIHLKNENRLENISVPHKRKSLEMNMLPSHTVSSSRQSFLENLNISEDSCNSQLCVNDFERSVSKKIKIEPIEPDLTIQVSTMSNANNTLNQMHIDADQGLLKFNDVNEVNQNFEKNSTVNDAKLKINGLEIEEQCVPVNIKVEQSDLSTNSFATLNLENIFKQLCVETNNLQQEHRNINEVIQNIEKNIPSNEAKSTNNGLGMDEQCVLKNIKTEPLDPVDLSNESLTVNPENTLIKQHPNVVSTSNLLQGINDHHKIIQNVQKLMPSNRTHNINIDDSQRLNDASDVNLNIQEKDHVMSVKSNAKYSEVDKSILYKNIHSDSVAPVFKSSIPNSKSSLEIQQSYPIDTRNIGQEINNNKSDHYIQKEISIPIISESIIHNLPSISVAPPSSLSTDASNQFLPYFSNKDAEDFINQTIKEVTSVGKKKIDVSEYYNRRKLKQNRINSNATYQIANDMESVSESALHSFRFHPYQNTSQNNFVKNKDSYSKNSHYFDSLAASRDPRLQVLNTNTSSQNECHDLPGINRWQMSSQENDLTVPRMNIDLPKEVPSFDLRYQTQRLEGNSSIPVEKSIYPLLPNNVASQSSSFNDVSKNFYLGLRSHEEASGILKAPLGRMPAANLGIEENINKSSELSDSQRIMPGEKLIPMHIQNRSPGLLPTPAVDTINYSLLLNCDKVHRSVTNKKSQPAPVINTQCSRSLPTPESYLPVNIRGPGLLPTPELSITNQNYSLSLQQPTNVSVNIQKPSFRQIPTIFGEKFSSSNINLSSINLASELSNLIKNSSNNIETVKNPDLSEQCARSTSLIPQSLKNDIGHKYIASNNMYLLQIEWSVCWFEEYEKMNCESPPPILPNNIELSQVKNNYKDTKEYYNTYFKLLLMECWHKMYCAYKETKLISSEYIGKILEYEAKNEFNKYVVEFFISSNECEIFPKESCIVLLRFTTLKKDFITMLGYVTSVMSRKFSPVCDHTNEAFKVLKCSGKDILKYKVTIYTVFKSDDIDIKKMVFVKKILNVRKLLLQNDALCHVQSSELEKTIVAPLKSQYTLNCSISHIAEIPIIMDKVVKSVLEPDPLLALINTPFACSDRMAAVSYLVDKLQESKPNSKVVICCKSEVTLSQISHELRKHKPVFVSHEKIAELQKCSLKKLTQKILKVSNNKELIRTEDRNRARAKVFSNCNVILVLLLGCHESIASLTKDLEVSCAILDESHFCTEPESVIPLTYNINKLILMGRTGIVCEGLSSKTTDYDYNRSLFNRAFL